MSTRAVAERRTATSNDTASDASYLEAFGDTVAEFIVPVFDADGAVVGTLDVESDRAGAFDNDTSWWERDLSPIPFPR